jgi:hypothetical protein
LVLIGASTCSKSSRAETKNVAAVREPKVEVQVSHSDRWTVARTRNFRVCLVGAETEATKLAENCEELRTRLQRRWSGSTQSDWSPVCNIIVYPRTAEFVRALGPGARGSSGASTIDFDRVSVRRIEIRGDADRWQREVLPHELTHVVLADLFTTQRIPPWADEGIAMLTESEHRLAQRRNDLNNAVQRGSYIGVRQVLEMQDPPQNGQRGAFYAESVSLAAFLMRRGGATKLVEFIHAAQREGYERAARIHYGFTSLNQLEMHWYAEMQRTDLGMCVPED